MLGYIAMQQRHFEEAEPELVRARALNPDDQGTELLLAELYSETNRQKQAEDVLRTLIGSGENVAASFPLARAHYMLGRVLRNAGKVEEGNQQIKLAEDLRRQLRANSQDTTKSRLEGPAAIESGNSHRAKPNVSNSADVANAQAFVTKISPLIGEAYYNLAGIAAQRKDSSLSSQYLQIAVAWDPSLAKAQH
jgi:tetratricopeptide (TPR) repeat protein